jgi:hypothetical protein
MNIPDRHRFRWSINEVLALHREYDLLGLSINEIALRHKRKPDAIVYKLITENIICENDEDDFNEDEFVTDHLYTEEEDDEEEDDEEEEEGEEEDEVEDDAEEEDEEEEEQQNLGDVLYDFDESYDVYDDDEDHSQEDAFTEKKEPDVENDIVEMYLYEYIIHLFNSYFFPTTTKYKYSIFY